MAKNGEHAVPTPRMIPHRPPPVQDLHAYADVLAQHRKVIYRLTLPGQTGTIAVGTAIAARFETMRSRAKSFIVFAALATAAGVVTPGVVSAGNDVSSVSLPYHKTGHGLQK